MNVLSESRASDDDRGSGAMTSSRERPPRACGDDHVPTRGHVTASALRAVGFRDWEGGGKALPHAMSRSAPGAARLLRQREPQLERLERDGGLRATQRARNASFRHRAGERLQLLDVVLRPRTRCALACARRG